MAEEDIIWGKNRHIFGGIQPDAMKSFNAYVDKTEGYLCINGVLPINTIIDGKILCDVAGVTIRGKLGSQPNNEFDGEHIATICEEVNGIYAAKSGDDIPTVRVPLQNIPDGGHYYYVAFPFSTQGVYNRSVSRNNLITIDRDSYSGDIIIVKPDEYLYGFDINLSNPHPTSRVSYPNEVDNRNYDCAKMDYTNGVFKPGSWDLTPGNTFMPKPVMLAPNGDVHCYLNPNNYEYTIDGEASGIANTSHGYNAMMQWPKIYTHREITSDNIYKFRCSNVKKGVDWECWSNYNIDGGVSDYFYTPIYEGCVVVDGESKSRLRSLSGQTPKNAELYETFQNYAKANCSGLPFNLDSVSTGRWNMETLSDRLLIQDLLIMISGRTDCQRAFGYGIESTSNYGNTGSLDDKGLFFGSYDDDNQGPVKVFGMENWWGNLGRFTEGWVIDNGRCRVKITPSTHDGSSLWGYSLTSCDKYLTLSVNLTNTNVMIKNTFLCDAGRLPSGAETGGSENYEGDLFKFSNAAAVYPAICGHDPDCSLIGADGPFTACFTVSSSKSSTKVGASLSFR